MLNPPEADESEKDDINCSVDPSEKMVVEPAEPHDCMDLVTLIGRLEEEPMVKSSPPPLSESPQCPPEAANLEEQAKVVQPAVPTTTVHLLMLSVKMSSIAHLLTAPGRLNSSAIKLCLTAQSQVSMRRRNGAVPMSPACLKGTNG